MTAGRLPDNILEISKQNTKIRKFVDRKLEEEYKKIGFEYGGESTLYKTLSEEEISEETTSLLYRFKNLVDDRDTDEIIIYKVQHPSFKKHMMSSMNNHYFEYKLANSMHPNLPKLAFYKGELASRIDLYMWTGDSHDMIKDIQEYKEFYLFLSSIYTYLYVEGKHEELRYLRFFEIYNFSEQIVKYGEEVDRNDIYNLFELKLDIKNQMLKF